MGISKILSKVKIETYETPPNFNYEQQMYFFELPSNLSKELVNCYTHTNRIGFLLSYGYFKACGRFFKPSTFRKQDVDFLCHKQGLLPFSISFEQYDRATYLRHRTVILNYSGYQKYDKSAHEPILKHHIKTLLSGQLDGVLLFNSLLEKMRFDKVELPTYHYLHHLIVSCIGGFQKHLENIIQTQLTQEQKVCLNTLIESKQEVPTNKFMYPLADLKFIEPKSNMSVIKRNTDKLQQLMVLRESTQSVLEQLPLNEQGIQYFGNVVQLGQVGHLKRKSTTKLYLHLLCFVAYQTQIFTDYLVKSFLDLVRSAIDKARRKSQENIANRHIATKPAVRKVVLSYKTVIALKDTATSIVWEDDKVLSPKDKIEQLQNLFPLEIADAKEPNWMDVDEYLHTNERTDFYLALEAQSLSLQKALTPLLKVLSFNKANSDKKIVATIDEFKAKKGQLTAKCSAEFLDDEEKRLVFKEGKFNISLFKVLLFKAIFEGTKSGSINLDYSYNYKAYDQYLIEQSVWDKQKKDLLKKANFTNITGVNTILNDLKKQLHESYVNTNTNIHSGDNKLTSIRKDGKFLIKTPKTYKDDINGVSELLPNEKIISLLSILSTINEKTNFLNCFKHRLHKYQKIRPKNRLFYASIMAYGCNIGISRMAKISNPINQNKLETLANNYCYLENIEKANDAVIRFTKSLSLPQIYKQSRDKLHTSSDGQKLLVDGDTIFSAYSFKYFGSKKGITSYNYLDPRSLHFSGTVFNSNDYEATYVLDGLLHNKVIKSDIHSTDTHGYTEAVFALMHLFGFKFAPRLKNINRQTIYSFKKKAVYKELGYKILPDAYINTDIIIENWEQILRLITSIQLKYCTASQIFKRLNSYSRQHPVYKAIKELGRIFKTLHILEYMDDVKYRQMSIKQLTKIEQSNQFTKAVFFYNSSKMIFLHRHEQLIAQACTRLIKNIIVCWNYLYLTDLLNKAKTQEQKSYILERIKNGSVMAWRHIHFQGVYDFSDDKLRNEFDLDKFNPFENDLETIIQNFQQ